MGFPGGSYRQHANELRTVPRCRLSAHEAKSRPSYELPEEGLGVRWGSRNTAGETNREFRRSNGSIDGRVDSTWTQTSGRSRGRSE
ncbi:unnamed protein product [Lampetra planeri]